jgi:nucleotide-binding universal stress UspA family protein
MATPFQNILIPVDFTGSNASALGIAIDLAVAHQTRVTLLHVIETIDIEPDAEMERFYAKLQARAEKELERLSKPFVSIGLATDRKIRFGKRLPEIIRDAAERNADLIIMSSHKPDLKNPEQTWGTLSYQVSMVCACPVLLVK